MALRRAMASSTTRTPPIPTKKVNSDNKRYSIHPLVLLSFDVYFYSPATTISKAQELNFDLSQLTEANWQGRDTYVVGTTDPTDNTSNQFWVDKENYGGCV
jgi:hypothetical protein